MDLERIVSHLLGFLGCIINAELQFLGIPRKLYSKASSYTRHWASTYVHKDTCNTAVDLYKLKLILSRYMAEKSKLGDLIHARNCNTGQFSSV